MSIKDFFSGFLNVVEITLKKPEEIFLGESATKLESIIYFTLLSLISFSLNFVVISGMNKTFSHDIFPYILPSANFGPSKVLLVSLSGLIISVVFSIIVFIVESILVYVSFKLSGVKSLSDIMFVISISMTPTLLFSWIPFIGPLIGIIWSSVLYLFGLRYKCGLTINGIVKGLLITATLHLVLATIIIFISLRFVTGFINPFYSSLTNNLINANQNYITENYNLKPLDYLNVYSYCNDTHVSVYLSNFRDRDIENLKLFLYDENNNVVSKRGIEQISPFEYKEQNFYVYDTHNKSFVVVITDSEGNRITHNISCSEYI